MGPSYIFIVRLILSILVAFIVSRFFFRGMSVVKIGVLALILLALAYLFERTRKKNKGG